MSDLTLVGRSSSHFTRITRMFAIELGVELTFRPLYDLTSLDVASYGDNPALKIPVLLTETGPLFGSENICRELVRRAGAKHKKARKKSDFVMRGDVDSRLVANAEELILHAMQTTVVIVLGKTAGISPSAKTTRSLENTMAWLDANVDDVIAALPEGRTISFAEVALFCLTRHLPFRQVLDVKPYRKLLAFADSYGDRTSARETEYRVDVK
jgi:glutathione S-transferase